MNRNRQQPKYNQQPQYNPPGPGWPANPYQPTIQVQPVRTYPPRRRRSMGFCSCALLGLLLAGLFVVVLLGAYFLAPVRTNLLVLGIDRTPEGTVLGRSDTIILLSVDPLRPTVKMLSIPRDLWVSIPGVGENRINTAHFFAEANQPGSGPAAAVQTVEENFSVDVPYYVRVRFDAFLYVVDALGGVDVTLPVDMAGLPAGQHHLDGAQALAFVRDRQDGDDFFRMEHGQFMLRTVAKQLLLPASWPRLPAVIQAGFESMETNLPFWQWPRLAVAILRAGESGIDNRTIQREMVTPTTLESGAQVLLPNWDRIHPLVDEMFSQ